MSETAYEIGAVLGTAVLGSVLAAAYRDAMTVPATVGPLSTEVARETLGGAVRVAGQLPRAEAQALLSTARAAFVTGVDLTALTGAGVLVAVVTVLLGLCDTDTWRGRVSGTR